jgi:penicillin-binding protein 2
MSWDGQGTGETGPAGAGDDEPLYWVPPGGIRPREAQPVDEADTASLPPDYVPPPLPKKLPKAPGTGGAKPWVVVVSVLAVFVVVAGTVFAVVPGRGGPGKPADPCGGGGACAAANAFLADYASGKYDDMYNLTSQASRQRFSDAAILNGAWSDAHDYIANRTKAILNVSEVTSIAATPGAAVQNKDGTVTVPVRVVLNSALVGPINENIKIPLVNEHGQWRVNWTPGLIFTQLDDPNDPLYRRHVTVVNETGQRGKIVDRDGNVLAQDTTVYRLTVAPNKVQNEGALLSTLSAKLGMSGDAIKAAYQPNSPTWDPNCGCGIVRTLTPQLYTQLQPTLDGLAGVQVFQAEGRVYPYGADAAAITGYTSVVTADDVKADPSYYTGTETEVGHAGVEQWGERYLRPVRGGKLEIVNVNADGTNGAPVYFLGERAGGDGSDIHLTTSLPLQQAALAAMRQNEPNFASGSFAVDPTTGEVLVMASNPSYDPNDFSLDFQPGIQQAQQSSLHPLLNCALQCADPTGSVFKVATLAASLENGILPTDLFTCKGSYTVPGETAVRRDPETQGHGTLTVAQALAPSCDVIFWQAAVKINQKDPNALPNMARALGYGTPLDIPGVPAGAENPGNLPSPQSVPNWSASNAADLGIGQGDFAATPAQVAMVTAAIGNNGARMQARLVSAVTDPNGTVVQAFAPKQLGTIPLTPDHLAMVQSAMVATTSTPQGTSYDTFRDLKLRIAGKTGTAQTSQNNPDAWFTCYAPASPAGGPAVQPKISIAVLVEYPPGSGDGFAAPVVKTILKSEFNI